MSDQIVLIEPTQSSTEIRARTYIHNVVHGNGAGMPPYTMLLAIYQNKDVIEWVGTDPIKAEEPIIEALKEYVMAHRPEVCSFIAGDELVYHGKF